MRDGDGDGDGGRPKFLLSPFIQGLTQKMVWKEEEIGMWRGRKGRKSCIETNTSNFANS